MNKSIQKALALLSAIVMTISLLPVIALPASAATDLSSVELDYDALFEDAYIVWPSGSTSATTWSFTFRGETKNVTYSSSKCFKSFSAAQTAFTRAVGTEGVVTQTPVYVLIGTVTISGTIYGNAIFLGANAGISPNADIDIGEKQATDPTTEWAAATRGTETVIKGSFVHGNSSTYDSAAKTAGVTEYNIIIDGIETQNLTTALVNNKCTSNTYTTAKDINVSVRNSILDFNKDTIYAVTGSSDAVNTLNVDMQNIRMVSSVHAGLFDSYASKITIDGMYYENTTYHLYYTYTSTPDAIDIVPEDFSFTMKNSVIRGTGSNSAYTRFFRFGLASGKNEINFINNIIYKSGYTWGIMSFKSGSDWNNDQTVVNFKHNLVLDEPTTAYHTLFEGGEHIAGPITLNMSYNRVIGYESMFPSLGTAPFGYNNTLHGTVSYNYFAPSFESVNDTAGVAPVFYSGGIDFYQFNSSIYTSGEYEYFDAVEYYTDYQMKNTSAMFDITETDFYDDLDYITINNAARIIRLRVAEGVTVSGLSKDYGFGFVTEPDSVSFSSTTLSSSASTSTITVTTNGSSVTYTIYAEGHSSPVSYTYLDDNDPTGTFVESRVYLYSPSGATTATIDGITYDFSGRSYTSMSALFSAAGYYKIPQIIIPAGEYDAITLTRQCEIYGECWNSPATGGVGADTRYPGDAWTKGKDTVIKGITLSSGVASSYLTNTVTVSGIVLTGEFTDTARSYGINLNFKNSVINGGYFNLQNSGTTSKTTGGFTISGVKVNSVGTAGKLITSNMPYSTTLDNVEIASSGIALGGNWATGLSSSSCALTVQNCYFAESPNSFISNISQSTAFSSATVTIKDSAFVKTATGRQSPSLLNIEPSYFKSVTVTGNWFVNKGSAYYTVFADITGSMTFTGNRLIGFDLGGTGNISKDGNYYAPYTYDYKTAANGRTYGSSYYLDPGLTLTNSDFYISSVSGGDATISEDLKTVYVNTTGAVSLTFSNGASYEVYSDKDCTIAASLSGEGTYYVKASYKGVTLIYNVRIDGGDDSDFAANFTNDTISKDALYATTFITKDNYGERVYGDFEGTIYSFVAGINAFASVTDALAYASEQGISQPEILIGIYQDTLSVPGAAKIYGGSYNTVPYVKTEDADLDWDYNGEYDLYRTSVTNIQIGPEANGSIEIHGLEMTGYYLDVVRNKATSLDVTLNNILINKSSTDTRVLFDLNNLNSQKNSSNAETFTVKNAYIQSATKTRLLYEFYPANVVFDGLYLDGNTFTINTTNYTKNIGTTTSLVFKNSNLRNYAPTSTYAFLFQGDDTVLEAGESKSLVFENNVLYNFSFGSTGILPVQAGKYSEISFKNNKVLSQNATYQPIFNYTNSANENAVKLTFTDNLLLGVNPESSIGDVTNIDTANSVIARNHTVSAYTTEGSGSPITITGASSVTEEVYAVDDTMAPLYKTDFVINDVASGDGLISEKSITSSSIKITLLRKISAAELDWSFGHEDIAAAFYSNSTCTSAVDASEVVPGYVYYMKPSYTADDGKVFTGDTYMVQLVYNSVDPAISAISATLYNDISVNFKTVGTDDYSDVKMVFTLCGETHEVTEYALDGQYTVFTFDGLAPHLMTEYITATLQSGDEVLDTYTVSLEDYCEGLMLEHMDNEVIYDLAVSLLNYGAAAQQYKNYNTDALANRNLSSTDQTITAPVLANNINTAYETAADAAANWKAHALILDSAVEIKLGFTANVPVSKLSVKVTGEDGTTVTLTDCFWYEDGKYYFIFDDLNLCQSDEMFCFTIMNGSTAVSDTLAYSVESYASVSQSDTTLKTLTQTLVNCSRAALAYKNTL